MDLAKALVTQAGPYMLAAKANALLAAEAGKGCQGEVLAQPVALEPLFAPLAATRDLLALAERPSWTYEEPPAADDLVRFQVWLSPQQPFRWDGQELFLKQLSLVVSKRGNILRQLCISPVEQLKYS